MTESPGCGAAKTLASQIVTPLIHLAIEKIRPNDVAVDEEDQHHAPGDQEKLSFQHRSARHLTTPEGELDEHPELEGAWRNPNAQD